MLSVDDCKPRSCVLMELPPEAAANAWGFPWLRRIFDCVYSRHPEVFLRDYVNQVLRTLECTPFTEANISTPPARLKPILPPPKLFSRIL